MLTGAAGEVCIDFPREGLLLERGGGPSLATLDAACMVRSGAVAFCDDDRCGNGRAGWTLCCSSASSGGGDATMMGTEAADLGSGAVEGLLKAVCERLEGVTGVVSPESFIPSMGDEAGDEGSL